MDALGALITESVSGMSPRQAALLFGIAKSLTITLNRFPFDPFQMLCTNNVDFHDIHHQKIGIKLRHTILRALGYSEGDENDAPRARAS
ncbi:hypothetical protein C8R44DRAFT_880965 [Mycena epipterygia]|nr:hypothetical protein C8R44DRAFT_880965 [Mycena epipterygia]